MDIEIGDGISLRCRVTGAGAGLQSILEIHGIGAAKSIKYIGNVRKFTDKYLTYPGMKKIVEHARAIEKKIRDATKGFETDDDFEYSGNGNNFIIAWERDCYVIKHCRGQDGSKHRAVGYYGRFNMDTVMVALLDYDLAASGATTADEAIAALNESHDRIVKLIESIKWVDKAA